MVKAHGVRGVPPSYTAYCRFCLRGRAPQFNIEAIYMTPLLFLYPITNNFIIIHFLLIFEVFYFVLCRIIVNQDPQSDITRIDIHFDSNEKARIYSASGSVQCTLNPPPPPLWSPTLLACALLRAVASFVHLNITSAGRTGGS